MNLIAIFPKQKARYGTLIRSGFWIVTQPSGTANYKDCIRLLFWSGQSFEESGLEAEGSFKAAEARYTSKSQIDKKALKQWLEASRLIQWDYKSTMKRKGKLERLR